MSELIQYRRCDERDVDLLKQLWTLCFPSDTVTEIDAFFENIYSHCAPFAGFLRGEPVTMLYLIPAQARNTDLCVPVWYLYAGGTHPSHRSQGYYRELMTVARTWANESEGYAIYLRPAEQSLFSYYAAMGYTEPIASHIRTMVPSAQYGLSMDVRDYRKRREALLSQSLLLWEPIEAIAEQFTDCEWHAFTDEDGTTLLTDGASILERLPISDTNISAEHGALWIPTSDDTFVIEQLRQVTGYSLLFGE